VVIVCGVIGADDCGIVHVIGCGYDSIVIAIALDNGLREQVGAIAVDVMVEEEECRQHSKCFSLARMHIVSIPQGQSYALPQGLILIGDDPGKSAAMIFLMQSITYDCKWLFVLLQVVQLVYLL